MQFQLSPNELNAVLHRRFACKKFDPNYSLSQEVLEQILEAARLAPSSCNTQPWEFIVLQGTSKEQISPFVYFNTKVVQTCAALVVVGYMHVNALNADYLDQFYTQEYRQRVVQYLQTLFKDHLRNEQALIEAFMKEQCYIAVGQMTLAATLMGVDSCIMGGFEAEKIHEVLNVYLNPPNIACLVALGKADMPITTKARKEKGSAIKYL
ncbi:NAD(P)H-dependent oxidoreductase [Helicobacter suis]|uniref:NAD(P)H-dependent oxidoreductase n=1 Tax=Helicobacter suis TaxID=104628 RepID=UPI0013D33BD7|nr:NAD(P)H-dependent oxidoreductase [Helicobacter suis]